MTKTLEQKQLNAIRTRLCIHVILAVVLVAGSVMNWNFYKTLTPYYLDVFTMLFVGCVTAIVVTCFDYAEHTTKNGNNYGE